MQTGSADSNNVKKLIPASSQIGVASPLSQEFSMAPHNKVPFLHSSCCTLLTWDGVDQGYNPAAEAFRNFDQDQPNSLMGSLHLDTEDEPRRGTSRANSVRFDERALQGPFGHGSRASSEFLPLRTGSAFGSHPLTERSSSHKSEGRQSSTGHSVHSARASSFGPESRPLSATVPPFVPLGPPPGLFVLGPVPSIIRCWLTTHFTNDSLLYAVVCTASYRSVLNLAMINHLGCEDRIVTSRDGQKCIKLPVYLPEATIQQSSSRSNSPAHQLPTITTEFLVHDLQNTDNTIQIYLGCDVLRSRNADIHFSLDRLTLLDDERNKLSVPLVRPENAMLYQNLQTMSVNPITSNHTAAENPDQMDQTSTIRGDLSEDRSDAQGDSLENDPDGSQADSASGVAMISPSIIGEGRRGTLGRSAVRQASFEHTSKTETKDAEGLHNGSTPDIATRNEGNNVWGSWRRDTGQGGRLESGISGYQRAGRGRGMKVLKPARLTTSRSSSAQHTPIGMEAAVRSDSPAEKLENQTTVADRRAFSSDVRPSLTSGTNKSRSANPVGGASAFGWLNSGGGKPATTGTGE